MYENIVAIIPARGGSKSIPNKNIISFCKKPLIAWTIEQAIASKLIKEVYVTTDCDEIAGVARCYGAQVILRPDNISTDTASSESALQHAISEIEKREEIDLVVFLQATSPLREGHDIDGAVEKLVSERADSLFSVAILEDSCIWQVDNGYYESVTFDYKKRGRRQERGPNFLENGSIYVFKPEILEEHKNRLGGKITIYPMALWKANEIDTDDDMEICEFFMRKKLMPPFVCFLEHCTLELIVYDFDGVLTDNTFILSEDAKEKVRLNRGDGLGISLIKKAGIRQMILSTETNKVVEVRAKKLGIPVLHGVENKKEALLAYCDKHDIPLKDVLYIGNDINDKFALKAVGHPLCPTDAYKEIKDISKIILETPGGGGVVRELAKILNLV